MTTSCGVFRRGNGLIHHNSSWGGCVSANHEEESGFKSAPQPKLLGIEASTPAGQAAPLGATVWAGGVNFSLYSRTASRVELLLFDREDDPTPARVFALDPILNHTYHYWHRFVPEVRAGQIYGYRVYGVFEPTEGMRFDAAKVLLDPYGRCVAVPKTTRVKRLARRATPPQQQ